ncbi:MAG: hypothetical protein AVDCRST_MAG73-782, partial [uncultured Thermomicrobiales bacterium]
GAAITKDLSRPDHPAAGTNATRHRLHPTAPNRPRLPPASSPPRRGRRPRRTPALPL